MPSKATKQPKAIRASAPRVAAPRTRTQTKTKRLPPAYAFAWLHLLPDSEFPIRSRDDMAAKISALLLGRASPAEGAGHALPARAQSQSGTKRRAR
jgi:hypothetical protein